MEHKITEEQHERLCAFLFDELEAEERAAFEAELAGDSALQAEAKKLEASIALVREFAPAAPVELSSASREALSEAAAAAVGAPPAAQKPIVKLAWYRHPGLQVAAAAALAIVSFRALDQRIHFTAGHGLRPEATRDVAGLDRTGYTAESDEEQLRKLGHVERGSMSAIGYSDSESLDSLTALGYDGGGDSASALAPAEAKGRGYKGPGDSVPPGGGVAPAEKSALYMSVGKKGAITLTSTPQSVAPTGGYSAATGADAKDNRPTIGLVAGTGGVARRETIYKERSAGGVNAGSAELQLRAGVEGRPVLESAGEAGGAEFDLGLAAVEELESMGYLSDDADDGFMGDSARVVIEPRPVDEAAEKKRKQEATAAYYERLIQRFQRQPNEKPSMMYFRFWGDNGFEFPQNDPLSTFAAEADTASYTLARKTIQNGYLPQRAQIRTEEFVNYFTPDVAPPTDGAVFRVQHELAPSLFGPGGESATDRWTLRVGVRGKVVPVAERAPLALTFVIDVSGSMKEGSRLELVKHALRMLAGQLKDGDSIAVVTFNTEAHRIFEMQSVGNKSALEQALFQMQPDGGTNAEAGLRTGYEEAVLGYVEGAVNRVVFLSDGVGNIGETNEYKLLEDVKRARDKGIYLNTIGVGMGNHNDRFLEQLADGGDGLCNYIDGPEEAERALVTNFTSAFQPIARDVKIQVEFDPKQVVAYRLLGYENRAIADADFRNDKVDAGELGSGHQVVALYELVLGEVDESDEAPLATTRVRYKQPYLELPGASPASPGMAVDGAPAAGDAAKEIEVACTWSAAVEQFGAASLGFQKSALAAEFAEMLRRSTHAKDDSVSLLRYKLDELAKTSGDPEVTELAALVQLAQPQLEAALKATDPVQQSIKDLAQFEWNCARREYLGMATNQPELDMRRTQLRASLKLALTK